MRDVNTPLGVVMPNAGYAAFLALSITLGAMIGLAPLDLPLWTSIIQLLIIFAVTSALVPQVTEPSELPRFTITDAKKLRFNAIVLGVVAVAAVVATLVF